MVYILSSSHRKGRYEVKIGRGSIFEQKHVVLPWWVFWARFLLPCGFVYIRGMDVACGLYKRYFSSMLAVDREFAAAFHILVGIARKGNLFLLCDCKHPGGWFCHGSVIRWFILEELRKEHESIKH
jgi:hypothetical protein